MANENVTVENCMNNPLKKTFNIESKNLRNMAKLKIYFSHET